MAATSFHVDAGPFDASPFDASPFDASPFDASPFDVSPVDVEVHADGIMARSRKRGRSADWYMTG